MFGNRIQKEPEEKHDDLSNPAKISENIQQTVNISDVSDTLIFKHDDGGVILLIIMLFSQLWSTKSVADLVEMTLIVWPSQLEVLVIRLYLMLPHQHKVVGLNSCVSKEIGS